MSLSEYLRNEVEKSGISANTLAKNVGLSQPTISRLLRGNDVKLSVAERLCDYFNLELRPAAPKKPAKRKNA